MKKLITKVLVASVLLASVGLLSSAYAADEVASSVAAPVASASEVTAPTPAVMVAAAPSAAATPVVAVPAPTPNKGDTAWMMVATMLVILMTIPGLALFYGGLVRSKNMLCLDASLHDFCRDRRIVVYLRLFIGIY